MARVDLRVSLLDQHVISSGEADTCPFEKRVHVRERERETRRPLVVQNVNEATELDALSCREFVAGAYS